MNPSEKLSFKMLTGNVALVMKGSYNLLVQGSLTATWCGDDHDCAVVASVMAQVLKYE